MTFTKATAVVLAAIYIFLWVLALNGASNMVPVLAVPLVLAVLVAFGVWLNRFMGITPRQQHFEPRPEGAAPSVVGPSESRAADAANDNPGANGDEGAAPPGS